MSWLRAQRRERQKRQASGILLALGLVLGVVAVVPAFASDGTTSCTATVDTAADSVRVAWTGVPDGEPVQVRYQADHGGTTEWITVDTDLPDDAAGYGPGGEWGPLSPIPDGAVAYAVRTITGETTCSTTETGPVETPLTATAELDCSSGLVVVTITNGGDTDAGAVVRVNGQDTSVTVAPGATEVRTTPVVSGQTYDVRVTAADGTVLHTDRFEHACSDPAPALTATLSLDCTTVEVVATIVNTGDAPGDATVTVNGQDTVVTVDAGGSTTWRSPVDVGSAVSARVTAGGGVLAEASFQDACADPAPELVADVVLDCDENRVVVTVTNRGDGAGSATVGIDGVPQDVDVAAGATVVVDAPVEPGASVEVEVTAGDLVLVREFLEEICVEPEPDLAATIALDCTSGRIVVVVTNDGDATGTAAVIVNGSRTDVPVAPGEQETFTTPVTTGTTYDVAVSYGNVAITSTRFVDVCRAPAPEIAATAAIDCNAEDVVVVLTNTGDAAGTARLTVHGATSDVVVPAGGSITPRIPVDPGQDVVVRVEVDGEVVLERSFSDVCGDPTPAIVADVSLDCDDGTVVVVLSNTGDLAGSATITVDGTDEVLTVAAGDTETWDRPVTPGETVEVTVTAGGATVATERFEDACTTPDPAITATVAIDCTTLEAVITLRNAGAAAGTASVTINGATDEVTVGAGEQRVVRYPVTEDRRYDIAVSVAGRVVASDSLVADCSVTTTTTASTTTTPGGSTTTTTPPAGTATIAVECSTNLLRVTLTNGTTAPTTFVVDVSGDVTTHPVAPGATVVVTRPLQEDRAYDVAVRVGDRVLVSKSFTHDCVNVLDQTVTSGGGTLARTGTNTFALVVAGLSMLGAGGLALSASGDRRRRLAGNA
jgi:hypothetical protein